MISCDSVWCQISIIVYGDDSAQQSTMRGAASNNSMQWVMMVYSGATCWYAVEHLDSGGICPLMHRGAEHTVMSLPATTIMVLHRTLSLSPTTIMMLHCTLSDR